MAGPQLGNLDRQAGVERLFGEMSREYLDEQRLRDLLALLECEIIDPGNGSINR